MHTRQIIYGQRTTFSAHSNNVFTQPWMCNSRPNAAALIQHEQISLKATIKETRYILKDHSPLSALGAEMHTIIVLRNRRQEGFEHGSRENKSERWREREKKREKAVITFRFACSLSFRLCEICNRVVCARAEILQILAWSARYSVRGTFIA
jgi:hypothetical protein